MPRKTEDYPVPTENYEDRETRRLLDQLAAADMAPPTDVSDVWSPMQLWARMIRDGEQGYAETQREFDADLDGKTRAVYDAALTGAGVMREQSGDDWQAQLRHNIDMLLNPPDTR